MDLVRLAYMRNHCIQDRYEISVLHFWTRDHSTIESSPIVVVTTLIVGINRK